MNFLGCATRGRHPHRDNFDCSGFTRHIFRDERGAGTAAPGRRASQAEEPQSGREGRAQARRPGVLQHHAPHFQPWASMWAKAGFIHAPRTGSADAGGRYANAYWTSASPAPPGRPEIATAVEPQTVQRWRQQTSMSRADQAYVPDASDACCEHLHFRTDLSLFRRQAIPATLGAIGVVWRRHRHQPLYTMVRRSSRRHLRAADRAASARCRPSLGADAGGHAQVRAADPARRQPRRRGHGAHALATSAAGRRQLASCPPAAGRFGATLFYGDSVITPAISVPGRGGGAQGLVTRPGAWWCRCHAGGPGGALCRAAPWHGAVGRVFRPVIVLWFAVLAVTGALAIAKRPACWPR